MRQGYCYSCGEIIGRKSANGKIAYDAKMRQISLVFRYEELDKKDEQGNVLKKAETRLHIPVCVDCCGNPDFDKIKLMMNKSSQLRSILNSKNPKAEFTGFEIDPVYAGKRITDED